MAGHKTVNRQHNPSGSRSAHRRRAAKLAFRNEASDASIAGATAVCADQAGLDALAAAMVSRAIRLAVNAAVRAVLATSAVASAPSYMTMSASASAPGSATPVSAASSRKDSRTQWRYSLMASP